MTLIRRITKNNQQRFIPLHRQRRIRLVGNEPRKRYRRLHFVRLLQSIREIDTEAFIGAPTLCLQEQTQLQMRDCIRRDEQFKPENPSDQLRIDILHPLPRAVSLGYIFSDVI